MKWPARFQLLEAASSKLIKNLNQGTELWLDGGHNPGAAHAIAAVAAEWKTKAPKPLVLVVGMIDTKDAEAFFKPLVPHAQAVVTMDVPGQDATIPAKKLGDAASKAGFKQVKSGKNLADALDKAAEFTDRGPPARVLICGSLYLAGYVLEADGREIK